MDTTQSIRQDELKSEHLHTQGGELVAVTTKTGLRLEVCDSEFDAVHLFSADGEHLGWVKFQEMEEIARRNRGC